MRRVCKPLYTEVFKDERDNVFGVVEFETRDDMKVGHRPTLWLCVFNSR